MARTESHTDDVKLRQPKPIEMDAPERDNTIIGTEQALTMDYAAQLAFMEDVLTIRIERGRDKYSPQLIDVYVNGEPKWLPVGVPVNVKRKFVEVLARAQPFSVTTNVGTANDERPHNRIERVQNMQHPFSVIKDPNPAGYEWLTRTMMDAV